jgi:[acyl-carrier-protein] S-malonyltransferase
MSIAFIFPGQGSQYIGMGKALYDTFPVAKAVFEQVNDSLHLDLTKIMFEGPEDQLNLTEYTQPALMAVSIAAIKVLESKGVHLSNEASFVAGHSLGEYSALTAASALEVGATAALLQTRGQAMQKAVPVGEGSMAAILGLEFADVLAIASEVSAGEGSDNVCQAANDNSNGQVVISGHKAAVEAAVALATEKGAKRAVILPVSAPFHCSLMAPAAQKMSSALAGANIRPPAVPVVSNVTAQGIEDPSKIRQLLVEQITGMVRWRESVIWMKEQGVTEMIEIGAGKVLSGLIRRIDRDIACTSVETPEQIYALVEKLNA